MELVVNADKSPNVAGYRWLTILSVLIAAGLVLLVAVRWQNYQWDFYMFCGAARDFASGVSPYKGVGLSFYHPPITLYGYRLFTYLPVHAAYTLWWAMKVSALAALLAVWSKHFIKLRPEWPTIVFFLLAFNGAVYSDLVAGNVSTYEELLLWFGFYQFTRKRYGLFSLCIILAAQVKITPILFATLLLVAAARPQWKWFAGSLLGFGAVFSLNFWLQPELTRNFLAASSHLDERGADCTSNLALVRDILDHVRGPGFSDRSHLDEALFLGVVAAVGLLSLRALLAYRKRAATLDVRVLIYFSCVVFALVSPRFKAYTYILLVIPTLYLLRAHWRSLAVPLAVCAVTGLVLFPQAQSLLPVRYAFKLFNDYLPLAGSFAVWFAYLSHLKYLSSSDASEVNSGASSALAPMAL